MSFVTILEVITGIDRLIEQFGPEEELTLLLTYVRYELNVFLAYQDIFTYIEDEIEVDSILTTDEEEPSDEEENDPYPSEEDEEDIRRN